MIDLEIALIAYVVMDPDLLAARRRPKVSAAARTLLASIARTRARDGRPFLSCGFPESLDLLERDITPEIGALAWAAANITARELAATGRPALVCDLLGATLHATKATKKKSTKADRLLELAGAA
jgi:hypothetical protein